MLDLFSEKKQKSAAVAEGVGLCSSPANGLLNAKKTSLLVAPQAHMGCAYPEVSRKFRGSIAVCRSLDFACLFPDFSILCVHKWSIFSRVSSLHTASLEHHRTVQYLISKEACNRISVTEAQAIRRTKGLQTKPGMGLEFKGASLLSPY